MCNIRKSIAVQIKTLVIGVCLLACAVFTRAQSENDIPTFSEHTYTLELTDRKWKYSNADSGSMAAPDYNDSHWPLKNVNPRNGNSDSLHFMGIGWFRLEFIVDSSWVNKPMALKMGQVGSSEIYLDGKQIAAYGKIGGPNSSIYYNPNNIPLPIVIATPGTHLMAVRYANYRQERSGVGFSMVLGDAKNIFENDRSNNIASSSAFVFLLILFFTISFLHFLFFLFYKKNVSNLFFAIFMLCIGGVWTGLFTIFLSTDPDFIANTYASLTVLACIACVSLTFFFHFLFFRNGKWWLTTEIFLSVATLITYFADMDAFGITLTLMLLVVTLYSLWSMFRAVIKKVDGAYIIGFGFGFFLLIFLLIIGLAILGGGIQLDVTDGIMSAIFGIILLLEIISIPVTISIYQAWVFSNLNKNLTTQLVQVQLLSEQTIKQEQEKKAILENQNAKLEVMVTERTEQLTNEKQKSDNLLRNILPEEVANELKQTGEAEAKQFNNVTVLFTDFRGFTTMSEKLAAKDLVKDLHECFSAFDRIVEQHGLEKIKTIGDAYMAAGGLPSTNDTHAADATRAAFAMRDFVEEGKQRKIAKGLPYFEIRIGIHTGPVVAGIVGVKKFQYDIWGDTVNTASRMESSGEVNKINISLSTYQYIKDASEFIFESRGKIEAKNKGALEMYFVEKN